MFTLGHNFLPESIHAGGLRYHGISPLVSQLLIDKLIEARSYNQLQTYEAGMIFARTEGIICAPETNHAIAAVIDEAKKAKEEGVPRNILFNLSGHGLLDLAGYDSFLDGRLLEYSLPEEEINKAVQILESHPKPNAAK
jgi:tryptophan synthase beta chain